MVLVTWIDMTTIFFVMMTILQTSIFDVYSSVDGYTNDVDHDDVICKSDFLTGFERKIPSVLTHVTYPC